MSKNLALLLSGFLLVACANQGNKMGDSSSVDRKVASDATIRTSSCPLANEIKEALRNGKGVILVAQNQEISGEDETYGDWNEYLTYTLQDHSQNYQIYVVTPGVFKALTGKKDAVAYNTLFLKNGYESYFSDGPIVEPQVYLYVNSQWSARGHQAYVNGREFRPWAPATTKLKIKKSCKAS